MGVDRGNLESLHHAHGRQADRTVIKANDAVHAILQDQALDRQLPVFGDTFGIGADDADAVIRAIDGDAAVGVNIGDSLLKAPIHANAADYRTWR